jgi:hypothetical protein
MTAWSPARSSIRHRCPRQYLLRYELKAMPTQPDDHGRIVGRVMHAGLAAALGARAAGAPADALTRPAMARYYPTAERAMMTHPDYPRLSIAEAMRACGEVHWTLVAIPPPHPAAILGVELPFTVNVDGEQINGVLDYAVRTGENSVHVRDWKSSAVTWRPTTDPAVPLYGWEARRRWPWATTITVGIYSIRSRREQVETLDPDASRYLLDRLVADAREARAEAAALTTDTVDALYPPRRGEHCRTCSFRSHCPLFRHVTGLPMRPGINLATERHRLSRTLEQRSHPELPST